MFLFKILIFLGIPALIVYIFWITFMYFRRNKPEEGSQEDKQINSDDELV